MVDELQGEMRERLVNVERKIDKILSVYLSEAEASGRYDGHPDQAFGCYTYAQHGEDLVVINAFEILGIPRPTYINIGAHHPLNVSNTALLHRRGSSGINIDANPNLIEAFYRLRPSDVNLNIGIGTRKEILDFYLIDDFSGRNSFNKEAVDNFVRDYPSFSIREIKKIDVLPLDDVIRDHANGVWPHFMSIDVEGLDYQIIEASELNSSWGPAILCCEVVSSLSGDASEDLGRLLRERGYKPFFRTIGNLLFARSDCYPKLGFAE